MSKFSERLLDLIFEWRISVDVLAQGVGTTKTSIYRYIKGKRVPSLDILVRIANYFDCSVDFLIGREAYNYSDSFKEELPLFSDRLLDLLNQAKKTRYVLSKETKIDESVIHWWIEGKRKPTLDSLIKVSNALDCSIDYLIGREN